jgi:hypothetical protein
MLLEQPKEAGRTNLRPGREPTVGWVWDFQAKRVPHAEAARIILTELRGGFGNSDTGISGLLPGHCRREVHAKAKT